jgi:hypothetical protein
MNDHDDVLSQPRGSGQQMTRSSLQCLSILVAQVFFKHCDFFVMSFPFI